ncbi:MAG: GTPase [Bacilli bacterium]
MNRCIGCGVELQTEEKNKLGYTTNIEKNLCERCFRIRNYGEYKTITKQNSEFISILKNINETKDLVVLVLDIFNLNKNLDIIKENIKNDILLVLTKRDILPKSTHDEKLLEYVDKYNLNIIDKIVISSNKNYNFDRLYEAINQYKKSKNVYVVGYTNAGKSTMINKIIYNYSDSTDEITTSILPSTTLNEIEIKINDELNIIDTPGILINNNFYNILSGKELKRIIPKKEIKPISYQAKEKQYILIDKYCILEIENINIVLFMSNTLNIKRLHKLPINNLEKNEVDINNCDLVINGLGFIKCIGKGKINVYTYKDIDVYTRNYLI